jgi:hypothetical protein
MVETEFLFGFQPKDKHYDVVSNVLKAYSVKKAFSLYYPVSAVVELREVMASHEKSSEERLNALTFIKAKAVSFGLSEVGLFSDDLILCEDLLMQHGFLTFFDGLHAAVALNNKFVVVSNDETCDKLGIERFSFKDFLDLLQK